MIAGEKFAGIRGGRDGCSSEVWVEGSSEFINAAILVSSDAVGVGSMSVVLLV